MVVGLRRRGGRALPGARLSGRALCHPPPGDGPAAAAWRNPRLFPKALLKLRLPKGGERRRPGAPSLRGPRGFGNVSGCRRPPPAPPAARGARRGEQRSVVFPGSIPERGARPERELPRSAGSRSPGAEEARCPWIRCGWVPNPSGAPLEAPLPGWVRGSGPGCLQGSR